MLQKGISRSIENLASNSLLGKLYPCGESCWNKLLQGCISQWGSMCCFPRVQEAWAKPMDTKHLVPHWSGGNSPQFTKLMGRAHIRLERSCWYLFLSSLILYSLVEEMKHNKQILGCWRPEMFGWLCFTTSFSNTGPFIWRRTRLVPISCCHLCTWDWWQPLTPHHQLWHMYTFLKGTVWSSHLSSIYILYFKYKATIMPHVLLQRIMDHTTECFINDFSST